MYTSSNCDIKGSAHFSSHTSNVFNENGKLSKENREGCSVYPRVWKPYLYTLQKKAPRPRKICSNTIVTPHPSYFGAEYHGPLSHQMTIMKLLEEGDYLIRQSRSETVSLSFRINGSVHHYRLYYDGQYYVTESRKFDSLDDLVADGLLCRYMDTHAGNYILAMPSTVTYAITPHATLRRFEFPKDKILPGKHHEFKVQTLKGLNWCDWCGNFMWGFLSQGVACKDCDYVAHQKCSEKVPNDCTRNPNQRIFGLDLNHQSDGTQVPFIVSMCVREIERRGLNIEGLYRMSGYKDEIAALKTAFEKDGINTDISPSAYENVHVLTGLLKQYLRLLPLPLIPYDVHEPLIKSLKHESSEVVDSIREVLKTLPSAHYITLKYLIEHWKRVVDCSQHTRMTAMNMATVINQTIMPLHDIHEFVNLGDVIKILEIIISKHNYIFS